MEARVGDLVVARLRYPRQDIVGQVVRQTDIMSELVTTTGSLMVRTANLEVVQPARLDHTQGRR